MSNEIRKPLFRQIVERQVWREDIQMIPQGDVFFIRAVRPPVYISYLLNELVEDIAAMEGITPSQAGKSIHDALRRLRRYFARQKWTVNL